MKTLFVSLFFFAASAFAQTPPVTKPAAASATPEASSKPVPTPIPVARQEAISREMITLQQAQLRLQAAQLALSQAQARYDAMVTDLQHEFNALGCNLTAEKTWQCAEAKAK